MIVNFHGVLEVSLPTLYFGIIWRIN